jgi:hypothetical protein
MDFAFIIPVRNPDDSKVKDYEIIELLLDTTLRSLVKQNNANIHIVVVSHRTSKAVSSLPQNTTFLNVDHIDTFKAGRNSVHIDKGFKYVIGILFAVRHFNPRFIMPMDADDYVHINLSSHVREIAHQANALIDGFILRRGVHVQMRIASKRKIIYDHAYEVFDFNRTCGSCRIFNAKKLSSTISSRISGVDAKFSDWPEPDSSNTVLVPSEPVYWLDEVSNLTNNLPEDWLDDVSYLSNLPEASFIYALGNHVDQDVYFNFVQLKLAGAAKGCGHGNHDGRRRGAVHLDRAVATYPIKKFLVDFGLSEPDDVFADERNDDRSLTSNYRFLLNRFRNLLYRVATIFVKRHKY